MQTSLPKNILVIDDEESIRFTFSYLLRELGHRVDVAESAEEALDKLIAKHYDLIFLDLLLGAESGITTLKQIRIRQPDTQVIMVTGAPDTTTVSQAISLGAYAYIPKPVRLETLSAITEKALRHAAESQP